MKKRPTMETYSQNTHPVVIISSKWFLNWHLLIQNWLPPHYFLSSLQHCIRFPAHIVRYPSHSNIKNSLLHHLLTHTNTHTFYSGNHTLYHHHLFNANHSATSCICMLYGQTRIIKSENEK